MSHKYMKDESGYCYTWTPAIDVLPELTPHDGDVDEHGFAVDAKVKPAKGKGKQDAAVEPEQAPE